MHLKKESLYRLLHLQMQMQPTMQVENLQEHNCWPKNNQKQK